MTKAERIIHDLDHYGNCPQCGESWDDGPIPEEHHEHCSEPYRYSKLIGWEDPELYDGISWWVCPFCNARWNRWTLELIEKGDKDADN